MAGFDDMDLGKADAGSILPSPVDMDEATEEVLRLHLDKFEGPLEVLLYLIRAQEVDVFDIPIAKITDQYLQFLEMMREQDLDVAGEFLVMAATLIQIKSKMLLPAELDDGEEEPIEEEDPRLELVEKLIEYRKYRTAAQRLESLEEIRANWYARNAKPELEPGPVEEEYLEVTLYDLIQAFRGVLRFFPGGLVETIQPEQYSVEAKIDHIEHVLGEKGSIGWTDLVRECANRVELVCCFLAVLELCRMGRLRIHQHRTFEEIRLFAPREDASG
jgi:segregation and condensation protein A